MLALFDTIMFDFTFLDKIITQTTSFMYVIAFAHTFILICLFITCKQMESFTSSPTNTKQIKLKKRSFVHMFKKLFKTRDYDDLELFIKFYQTSSNKLWAVYMLGDALIKNKDTKQIEILESFIDKPVQGELLRIIDNFQDPINIYKYIFEWGTPIDFETHIARCYKKCYTESIEYIIEVCPDICSKDNVIRNMILDNASTKHNKCYNVGEEYYN